MYKGQSPFKDLKQNMAILYLILRCTGSQCNCLRRGVMCSDLGTLRISLAALFCTL